MRQLQPDEQIGIGIRAEPFTVRGDQLVAQAAMDFCVFGVSSS